MSLSTSQKSNGVYRFMHFAREIKMKLNLLFFVMDMLTLLAYPIVYLHSKVYRFFRDKRKHHAKKI